MFSFAGRSDVAQAAVVAALAAEADQSAEQRQKSIMERMTRIEESIAMLLNDDVADVSIDDPDSTGDSTGGSTGDEPALGTADDVHREVGRVGSTGDKAAKKRIKDAARNLGAPAATKSWS